MFIDQSVVARTDKKAQWPGYTLVSIRQKRAAAAPFQTGAVRYDRVLAGQAFSRFVGLLPTRADLQYFGEKGPGNPDLPDFGDGHCSLPYGPVQLSGWNSEGLFFAFAGQRLFRQIRLLFCSYCNYSITA